MLVLSRKPGEEIVIDGSVRVTVVGVHGNQVLLGVTAPFAVPIWRAELARDHPLGPASAPATSPLSGRS